MTISKSEASGPAPSQQRTPPIVARNLAQRMSAGKWLTLAAASMLISTAILLLQRPWRHPITIPAASRSWLLESMEWNSAHGLPAITGNINAVAIQPGSRRIWIAGDNGLLAFSDADGDHWTKLEYDAASATFSVPENKTSAPAQSPIASAAFRAEASTLAPPDGANQQRPPMAKQPPSQGVAPAANAPAGNPSQVNMVTVAPTGKITAGDQKGQIAPAKPDQSTSYANWPPPNLLSLNILRTAVNELIMNSGDGRLYRSIDSGAHWAPSIVNGQGVETPNTFDSAVGRSFQVKSSVQPPRVTREAALFNLSDNKTTLAAHYADKNIQRSDLPGSPGAWSNVATISFAPLSLSFFSRQAGCVVGSDSDGGVVQCTHDLDKGWLPAQRVKIQKGELEDIAFAEDFRIGWAVRTNGVVLWTADGGDHWQAKTQSAALGLGATVTSGNWWRLLPLWFYAAWAIGFLCTAIAPFSYPAALLTTVGKGNRVADLDAQISFRDKFAREFCDVTKSLGENQQLVVFIDDLDRCRPENVRDVLEAVNFLVTSGGCFVVMGLERQSVEAAVGLSLKDIAAEMTAQELAKKRGEELATGAPEIPVVMDEKTVSAARRKYASNFLDKLINIEVPIPRLDPNKARGLFFEREPEENRDGATEAALLEQRERKISVERLARMAFGAMRYAAGFVVFLALLSAAYAGWSKLEQMGRGAAQQTKAPESRVLLSMQSAKVALQVVDTNSVASPPPANPAPVAMITSKPGAGTPDKVAPPVVPAASTGPKPEFKDGLFANPPLWILPWPEIGIFALLITIVNSSLVKVGKGARHDSETFVRALSIWYPLVMKRQPTPRAVKRWMNRVRYLATRELPSSELRSPIERFSDWYAARGVKNRAVIDAAAKTPQPGRIPEDIVVALAAIHELAPNVFESPDQFRFLMDLQSTEIIPPGDITDSENANQLIRDARKLHSQNTEFTNWNRIKVYAPRFFELWPSIKIQ